MFGIYVHYPYCARHCPYCDFNVAVTRTIPHDDYRDAVLAELAVRALDYPDRPAPVSLYFGGGTPGLWPATHIGAVIDAVAARLALPADAEITVECNPEDITAPGIAALRTAGVNRISLGVQSFDDALLARLGRHHTGDDARAAVANIRRGGLEEISLDLIHGHAAQTLAGALADVHAACALAPTHLSTYQLTVEDRTAFGARAARGETLLGEETLLLSMYHALRDALRQGGLVPYEISNAARPGHEARHNTLYWTHGEYLALGAGAHGFLQRGDGAERWENERHPGRYITAARSGRPAETFRDTIAPADLLEERVMCGLRLDAGIPVDPRLAARFGPAAARLEAHGLLTGLPDRWRVTDRGRAILDRVVFELVTDQGS